MDYLNVFTSTGIKLIHHPEVIEKIRRGFAEPISLQVAPTSRCNLNCSFCSNTNRKKDEDLEYQRIMKLLIALKEIGLKAVEITGGGEPTIYKSINELIGFCSMFGLKIGLISNGIVLLKNVSKENLDRLTWLRISMNCLDYYPDTIKLPKIKGTLGFSYVWNKKTNPATIDRLKVYVSRYSPAYVRIVPDCQATDEEQAKNNKVLGAMVSKLGNPFFYQAKVFYRPNKCYWGYMKPFLLHDGWVYPCSSVVLNQDADRKFHERYRWVKAEELSSVYNSPMKSVPTVYCNHCVFSVQNELVRGIMNPSEMNDFV